jgi:hypothetical protein
MALSINKIGMKITYKDIDNTTRKLFNYTYDELDKLDDNLIVSYEYDVAGHRISKTLAD